MRLNHRLAAVAWIVPAAALAAAAPPANGAATLKDAGGKEVGRATFEPAAGGVTLKVQVSGLKPGPHGIHVHAAGKCEAPEFTTAGGHFNPAAKKHGLQSPMGHHGGDLPNLVVGSDGRGDLTATLSGVSLGEGAASLFHEGGTALVIHAGEDDEKTDPAGNSGPRVACGVIQREK